MTNNLIAKPVVNNQYWIVTDGKQKVGNVIADGTGFDVRIGNTITHYSSTRAISVKEKIEFVSNRKTINNPILPTFSQYPTGCTKLYNSVLDIKRKLHLYTKTKKSKCLHAAGWFTIKQGAEYTTILAPKYIFIQRYKYFGPFMTKDEAENVINSV
jgi:hypothetical protein